MTGSVFISVMTLSIIVITFSIFELGNWIIDGKSMFQKKCDECKKLKLRWNVSSTPIGYYTYRDTCKVCKKEEERKERLEEQKRNEFRREDELIGRYLDEPSSIEMRERIMRAFLRE